MRGLKRTAATLAAIGLSAGILAGCGGSSSTDTAASTPADTGAATTPAVTTATTASITPAEYKAKVSAICTKLDSNMSTLDNADVNSVSQAKAAIKASVAEAEAGVTELAAVTPPADLQAAHDALVQSSQASIDLFTALMSDLDSGTTPSAASLKASARKAGAIYVKQRAAIKALGLKGTACFPADTGDDSDGNDTNDGND